MQLNPVIPLARHYWTQFPHLSPIGQPINDQELRWFSNENSFLSAAEIIMGEQQYRATLEQLNHEIRNGGDFVEPRNEFLLRWAQRFPIDEVRAVIVGREPSPSQYSPDGWREFALEASGFAYHPLDEENVSRTAEGVMRSIDRTFNADPSDTLDHSLNNWIDQEKVLLLNWCTSGTIFTNERGRSAIDPHLGWASLTQAILLYILRTNPNAVIIHALNDDSTSQLNDYLAHEYENFKDRIVRVRHPSFEMYPDTANQPTRFPEIGTGLQECNEILIGLGATPIDWLNLTRYQ